MPVNNLHDDNLQNKITVKVVIANKDPNKNMTMFLIEMNKIKNLTETNEMLIQDEISKAVKSPDDTDYFDECLNKEAHHLLTGETMKKIVSCFSTVYKIKSPKEETTCIEILTNDMKSSLKNIKDNALKCVEKKKQNLNNQKKKNSILNDLSSRPKIDN